uniref:Uncharacterized protein n=1 Tax=Anopheles atroparvus TaxID=41427 RepID=A0AAG5DPJ2_ANOAO
MIVKTLTIPNLICPFLSLHANLQLRTIRRYRICANIELEDSRSCACK